jgi:hypothetical protein
VNKEYTTGKNKISHTVKKEYTAVSIENAVGSSETPDHTAKMAADTFSNTFWQTDPNDTNPSITITFTHKADLKFLIVSSGDPATFSKEARPHHLHLIYSNDEPQDIFLEDKPTPQTIALKHANGVDSVQIQIDPKDLIPITGVPGPYPIAVTEFEFKQPK